MNTKIIERAAALLQEDAQAGFNSCTIGDLAWACPDCPAKRGGICREREASEERQKIAAELLKIA